MEDLQLSIKNRLRVHLSRLTLSKFSFHYFPYLFMIFSLFFLGILFVTFRMKRIELDYSYYEINKKIDKAFYKNKELRAQLAKNFSIEGLTLLAKRHHLNRPKKDQIIIMH